MIASLLLVALAVLAVAVTRLARQVARQQQQIEGLALTVETLLTMTGRLGEMILMPPAARLPR